MDAREKRAHNGWPDNNSLPLPSLLPLSRLPLSPPSLLPPSLSVYQVLVQGAGLSALLSVVGSSPTQGSFPLKKELSWLVLLCLLCTCHAPLDSQQNSVCEREREILKHTPLPFLCPPHRQRKRSRTGRTGISLGWFPSEICRVTRLSRARSIANGGCYARLERL